MTRKEHLEIYIEDAEEIKEKRGYSIEELNEGDYCDIVYEMTGIEAKSAWYDKRNQWIIYTYEDEDEE